MVGFSLSYATFDWLSYHVSHQTKLCGSFETELQSPSSNRATWLIVIELQGYLETELQGSLATWPSGL